MKKFTVFSGFLGSGKTSTMMALTKYFSAHHAPAAMISNDLGSQSLADNKLAVLSGCNASELVTDEYNYKRYLTLSVDEDIRTIEITSYIKYITAYDYILTDFKDEIKGTPYFKTITN